MRLFRKSNLINLLMIIVVAGVFVCPLLAAEKQPNTDVMIQPGKFVVKFKPTGLNKSTNQSAVSRITGQYPVHNLKEAFAEARNSEAKKQLNLNNVFIMETSKSADIWQIINELNRDPEVEYAEPLYIVMSDAEPNDMLYSSQYHLPMVLASEAWDLGYGTSEVIIGVLDSGVDWDHEDLANIIWSNEDEILDGTDTDGNGYIDDIRGWDFVTGVSDRAWPGEDGEDPDNNPMDFNGHGTHVAGLAAAHTNNNIGIASVSSGALIMPLRAGWLNEEGNGPLGTEFLADGIIYAADNGAHILNCSWGGGSGFLTLDAANYAFINGVLVIKSGGNGNDIDPDPLDLQNWILNVAALNSLEEKATYSSYGPFIEISAPGGDFGSGNHQGLLSTIVYPSDLHNGNQYVQFQGTSMAAPLVASIAGLIKSHEPELTNFDLFTRLVGTADNIDDLNPNYIGSLGSGRVNAYRALTEVVNSMPEFSVVGSEIDEISGNDDGFLDPGEQVTLTLRLRNKWQDATNVTADISVPEDSPISIESGVFSLGDVGGILNEETWETEASFTISCDPDVLPLPQMLTVNINGDGFTSELGYYLAVSPRVLFVADFDNTAGEPLDFSPLFQDAFLNSGISHDLVYNSETIVDYNLLNRYPMVVWGCEWSFPSLDAADRSALQAYLDNGGALFLSGQDIAWDLGATGSELNEYFDSNGASATFLNNYLKSNFVSDIAGFSEISGVENDPIGDELEVDFYQTLRSVGAQYPDAISPVQTATSVFDYFDGRSGAIRYQGDYRLVYFGFAGFEGITDENTRNVLIRRTVNYLDGIEIVHERQRDTEQTVGDYEITAAAFAENDTIAGADLYWSNDEGVTRTKVAMVDMGENNFASTISAQESGSTVQYFIYVTTEGGNYAFSDEYSFEIGPDMVAPTAILTNPYITQTINAYGPAPYEFIVRIDDNLGIDSSSAQLYFSVNEGSMDSTSLSHLEKDKFTGTFSFEEALSIGDQIDYYAQVRDLSSTVNTGKSATHTIQIDTMQVIDDFEEGDWRWDLDGSWGLFDGESRSGEYSITDSPDGDINGSSKVSLSFNFPFNLSTFQFAQLDFYMKSSILAGDSLLVEVSNDGGNSWELVKAFTRSSFSFRLQSIDLSAYTGMGNENVQIRFSVTSGAETPGDGFWIDDISFKVSEQALAIEDGDSKVPLTYNLKQNYPNPFNPSTTIQYSIPKTEQVVLTIYTITGEKVKNLVSDKIEAGNHSVQWNGSNDQGHSVASGVYIYRIKTKGFNKSMKMLFLK